MSRAPAAASPMSGESAPARAGRPTHAAVAWRILGVGAAGAAVAGSAAWVLRAWIVLRYPFQLDYMEGVALNWAAWAQAGLGLYPPVDDGPFIHHAYMPLYMGLVTAFGELGVLNLPALRCISIVPSVLTAAVIAGVVRRRVGGLLWPALAVGLWLSFPAVYVFGMFVRPEPLATLLCAVGFARLRPTQAAAVEAVLWFGGAILCKQPFLFSAVAAGAWLLLRAPRAAVTFGVGMAVFGTGMLLIAFWRTGAQFWWHTVVATRNPWSWEPVGVWAVYNATHIGVPVALCAGGVVAEWRERKLSPWAVYAVGAWLGTLLVGKEGSALQYFVEPALPTTIVAVSTAARWFAMRTPVRLAIAAAVLAGTIVPLRHWPGRVPIYRYDFTPTPAVAAERSRVVAWIRAHPGEVVCFDLDLVVLADKLGWLQPWIYRTLGSRRDVEPRAPAGAGAPAAFRCDPAALSGRALRSTTGRIHYVFARVQCGRVGRVPCGSRPQV